MVITTSCGLSDVQAVYAGPERELWELLMGEQIHIGGLESSIELADRAGIRPGSEGVDLCCCTGAGMRFLVRMREVGKMHGVDATAAMVQLGMSRTAADGLSDRITFTLADACETGLADNSVDFVWGEDAWCYVEDKHRLISEAVRLVRPHGIVAFTDWMQAGTGLSDEEAQRFLGFMKFPSLWSLEEYTSALEGQGCEIAAAENTGRFELCLEMYINYVARQKRYDALKILGWNTEILAAVAGEMQFALGLAKAGKIAQCLVIAKKK